MHVVVTGGSSGIGLEIARIYARRGFRVSLIARDSSRLEAARSELVSSEARDTDRIQAVRADVTKKQEISAALDRAQDLFGPCDVLIASAGIVLPGRFEALSAVDFDAQINTNLFGVTNTVRAVYPQMLARGQGRIVIVSSGAALIGLYGYTAYCAAKFALAGFAEALSTEAHDYGVGVTIAFPPDTDTAQFQQEIFLRPKEAQYLMGKAKLWTAQAVAERIVKAIDGKKSRIFFGFGITMLGLFGGLIKPFLYRMDAANRRRRMK